MIESGKILQQRYRIQNQIGQGGMGAVYVATDERFGSTVAIKETLFMDDNYRKAIEREARLLNSLKHPALPRVTDHFLEENGQFLVMEFIAGEDLAHILETGNRPFPVDQVLTWADQLLDALDFLHNQVNPVIHRDIKPQNLKVTGKGQIILLDFGLAKGNPTDAGHQTAAKSIFGYSRNYASLEQIQGTGTDPRSDLYSLAATLYHLLTNTPPEDALTRAMAVLAHQPDPLIPANRIVSEIPAGVAGVLQVALDLNAPRRPASAAEMRQMLREHEQYAAVVENAARATAPIAPDIFTQHTRLMPGSTQAAVRGTEVKTEILPNQLSQLTALKAATPDTVSRRGRGVGFVTGALASLAFLAAIAGGAYLYNPELFRSPAAIETQTLTPAEPAPPVEVPGANADVANANVMTEPSPAADTAARAPSASAQARAGESSRPSRGQSAAANPDPEIDPGKIVIDGETIYMGNTKITPDGRIETPNRVITENGISPRQPNVQHPPIPPPDLRHLTPQQRRRVLRALRQSGVQVRPAPSPED